MKTPSDDSKPDSNQTESTQENSPDEEVSPFIEAYRILSHITTALVLMLICGGIGYAIDYCLGINGIVLIGFLCGGALAIRHLSAVTSQSP